MWVAIEATTIASAMLIALDVTKASVEASWKYVLLGSVGIAPRVRGHRARVLRLRAAGRIPRRRS